MKHSVIDANNSRDGVGSALQLLVLAIALIFLLYSFLGLLVNLTNSVYLPSSLLSLIGVFTFAKEFLLFYLQRKDPSGIENRYHDLLLGPLAVCVFSTIFEVKSRKSNLPKLVRGLGVIHRARAFATLQFNCHLVLSVVTFVGLRSMISRKNGAEMQSFENSTQFCLDSDHEADEEIKEDSVER